MHMSSFFNRFTVNIGRLFVQTEVLDYPDSLCVAAKLWNILIFIYPALLSLASKTLSC